MAEDEVKAVGGAYGGPADEALVRFATYASVATALVLIVAKVVAYLMTDSVSLLSTLLDSLLDVAASLLNLIAVRHALTPADREHRFGHGKAEPLAGLGQAAFITGSAIFLISMLLGTRRGLIARWIVHVKNRRELRRKMELAVEDAEVVPVLVREHLVAYGEGQLAGGEDVGSELAPGPEQLAGAVVEVAHGRPVARHHGDVVTGESRRVPVTDQPVAEQIGVGGGADVVVAL